MISAGTQIDTHTWIQDVRVEETDAGIDIAIAFGSEERYDVPIASIKACGGPDSRYDSAWRMNVRYFIGPDSSVGV